MKPCNSICKFKYSTYTDKPREAFFLEGTVPAIEHFVWIWRFCGSVINWRNLLLNRNYDQEPKIFGSIPVPTEHEPRLTCYRCRSHPPEWRRLAACCSSRASAAGSWSRRPAPRPRPGHPAPDNSIFLQGLRIHIHFILIRIQHFRLNTDPDPIRIQIRIQSGSRALMTKN